MTLILASASPRRLELLERVGLSPLVIAAEVDESTLPGEGPSDYVLRVAVDKAHVVAAGRSDAIVIAADTTVVLDGEALGKPLDPADAIEMLKSLVGRTHHVLTAVVAIGADGIEHSLLARTAVTMAPVETSDIEWYVATGEPMDKAGSYAIQGIGAFLVERIEGDPTTVIGLPLRDSLELLRRSGVHWPA